MFDVYNLFVLSICHVCGSYQCPYCPVFSWSTKISPSSLTLLITILSYVFCKKIIQKLQFYMYTMKLTTKDLKTKKITTECFTPQDCDKLFSYFNFTQAFLFIRDTFKVAHLFVQRYQVQHYVQVKFFIFLCFLYFIIQNVANDVKTFFLLYHNVLLYIVKNFFIDIFFADVLYCKSCDQKIGIE